MKKEKLKAARAARDYWRSQAKAQKVEVLVLEEQLAAAEAQADAPRVVLEEQLALADAQTFRALGRVAASEATVRNVLRALGPDRPNWDVSTAKLAKARSLCRDFLDSQHTKGNQ